jgi:hypothetical protein
MYDINVHKGKYICDIINNTIEIIIATPGI